MKTLEMLLLAALCVACAEAPKTDTGTSKQGVAWHPDRDNPDNFEVEMTYRLADLPASGESEHRPWPGSYWPTYRDSINYKWAGPGTLSPTQKYERAFGLQGLEDRVSNEYGVDKYVSAPPCNDDAQCSALGNNSGVCAIREGEAAGVCMESWYGVCHAWAPAAVLNPQPLNPVVHNGVRFEVNDLKALIALTHDKGLRSKSVSFRCDEDDAAGEIAYDADGIPLPPECADTNAGTFHVVVASMLGLHRRAFIEDRTYDEQVWNQPVYKYAVRQERAVTGGEANALITGAPAAGGDHAVVCDEPPAGNANGFDWGGACEGGEGDFRQPIQHQALVEVGEIPAAKAAVRIELTSDRDVDIQLVDRETGHQIIAWPNGQLSGAGRECGVFEGVEYCYSGYNGDGTGQGHEYIEVRGETNRPLIMKAFGYAAGDALVEYSWQAPAGCVDQGCGTFTQPIARDAVVRVGAIPAGKEAVRIALDSRADVDVQLIDDATGTEIIAWPNGLLNGSSEDCVTFRGVEYCYSGYTGGQSAATLGEEWIEVRGTTNRPLTMKAFGYAAGDAEVNYEWVKAAAPAGNPNEAYRFNPEAASLHYLKTELFWIHEPAQELDGPLDPASYTSTDTYEYILELDGAGRIIGGEWVGSSKRNHPDTLWLPTGKFDVSIARDGWDDATGIRWTEVEGLLQRSL